MKKLIIAASILLCSLTSSLADGVYFIANGILGEVTIKDFPNHTKLLGYSHEVGQGAAGKRQHGSFKILKAVSGNSPQFADRWVKATVIPDATLKLARLDQRLNRDVVFYTYAFTGLRITNIRNWMPNTASPTSATLEQFEEITFTYQSITWSSPETRETATDTVQP